MQYAPNLGETPTDDARRDCVHVAVAPVVAGEDLVPGERVGLLPDGRFGVMDEMNDNIGVVDPFRIGGIGEGRKFWLYLYPNTITSLRHVWSHPAFQMRIPEALP